MNLKPELRSFQWVVQKAEREGGESAPENGVSSDGVAQKMW